MPARALKFPNAVQGLTVSGKAIDTLFDEKPIAIGGFVLRSREALPGNENKPSIVGWQAALEFACAADVGSPFWIGDLVVYGRSRPDWKEKLDQAIAVSKMARQTIENRASISRRVTGRARAVAPSLTHAAVVAKLDPAVQEELLERAHNEELTVAELGDIVSKRKNVLKGQAAEVHDVIVSVCVSVEATTGTAAERLAWDAIKPYLKSIKADQTVLAARIVGAKARPK